MSAERWIGVAQPVVGNSRGAQPGAPEAGCGGDPRLRFLGVRGCGELLGPRQGAERLVARVEDMARAHSVAFDVEREIGDETKRLPSPACFGGVAVAVAHRP